MLLGVHVFIAWHELSRACIYLCNIAEVHTVLCGVIDDAKEQ